MSTIELSKGEIIDLQVSMEASVRYSIPASCALKVATITRKLDGPVKDFKKVEEQYLEQFAKKEDGKIIYRKDNKGRPTQEPILEDQGAYIAKRNDLLSEVVEVDLPLFKQKDFDAIFNRGGSGDKEKSEEKDIPPIVLKAWVTLMDDEVDIEKIFE